MKRIDVFYDGLLYTISERELADVEREIVDAVESGTPHWLVVNSGEGRYAETHLLVTASTSIGLSPVQIDDPPPGESGPIRPGEVRVGGPQTDEATAEWHASLS